MTVSVQGRTDKGLRLEPGETEITDRYQSCRSAVAFQFTDLICLYVRVITDISEPLVPDSDTYIRTTDLRG
jgi:hypothetical protein